MVNHETITVSKWRLVVGEWRSNSHESVKTFVARHDGNKEPSLAGIKDEK